jgi:hypothetical protein
LRGFTGFSESSDPEDVMTLLRDYHAAVGEIIIKYSGTLERYAGDGASVPGIRAILKAKRAPSIAPADLKFKHLSALVPKMSAPTPRADIYPLIANVRYGPIADMANSRNTFALRLIAKKRRCSG